MGLHQGPQRKHMIQYLLIDERPLLPYNLKWRIFTDKALCLEEARKLGWGGSIIGSASISDQPGMASIMTGGGIKLTIIPVQVEEP